MKDMVKVEFPSKKALSHEGPELCHLCQVKYFVVMKSEPTPHDISIDAGLPIEWGAYPVSTTALNIVSPSTYFERTSAVNTTLPDDAVQLHHCLLSTTELMV